MCWLKGKSLEALLDRVRDVRIGVVGDFCLDVYLDLDQSRSVASAETGREARAVREQRCSPGGAGNVAANCASTGVKRVHALGAVGADMQGREARSLLDRLGIDTKGLVVQERQWSTHVYTKILADGAELDRLDLGNFNVILPESSASLLTSLEDLLPALDCLIINQQVRWGIHSSGFRRGLVDLLSRFTGVRVVTDSRHYSDDFHGSIRKLNHREAAAACGIRVAAGGEVTARQARDAGETLARRWGAPVVLTRGDKGCLVAWSDKVIEIPGVTILPPVDPVGAGDSFLAGFAAALATGEQPETAAQLGNYCAAVTVTKLHVTGTATREEILAVAGGAC